MRVRGLLILAALMAMLAPVHAQEVSIAVLVSDNPADYAVAQLLAEKLNATLVVTPWGVLTDEAVAEIEASGATLVYVVGGPVAVPDVEVKIKVEVKRIAGKDRYETAAIAASLWNATEEAIIVEGMDEYGIREALKRAKALGVPILLVKDDDVPEEVREAVKRLKAKRVHLIPAPDMNHTRIKEELKEHVEDIEESRVDMQERAAEAIEDAREEIAEVEAELNTTNITTGWELAAAKLLITAKRHLKEAEEAYNQSLFGRAFGLAVAAENKAEAADRLLERVAPGYYRRHVEEAEEEIEMHGIERAREELEKEEEMMEKAREMAEEKRERAKERRERARAGKMEFEEEHEYENATNMTMEMRMEMELEHEEEGLPAGR
ncbi:MAG: hypothetical protein GXO66_03220 [Euryarchaeota archaeon]|nr:hypothetical protein [Euryarchaeota archaeon]